MTSSLPLGKHLIYSNRYKRGSQTSKLHALAKEYQIKNPEIAYKTILKIVGQELREKNQTEINNI